MKKGMLLVVSGPSGVGKGTVCKELMKHAEELSLYLSVSVTTRQPRPGEQEGVNYFFKSREEFLHMREAGEFLESFEIYENCYGTPKNAVLEKLEQGKNVLLEIDTQGGIAVLQAFSDAVGVFILPPSAKELCQRLSDRGTESADSMKIRTGAALEEMKKSKIYHYVVVNDSVERAVCDIITVIKAEGLRTSRNSEWIETLVGGETK